ncbi:MAG: putative membrane protein [Anaerolinea thermophila]|uniref:Putative membrane protein n=1 Tax=Anaerolinea thermophila TaxID=167964 RepID=A0A101FWX5_9CHLR|nr:MAG: putative membrane protein [Anaerolinea thermophila]
MIEKEDKTQKQTQIFDDEILPDSEDTDLTLPKTRIRLGLIMAVVGYFIFLLGARPGLFGLDRSRVIGFVQISVFLVGLALISLGSYLTLNAMWPNGKKTIAADIGIRLISTGYVISVFTAMADIFGLGSHPLPDVFFGPLQARGMELGMITIAIGFLLLIRYKLINNHSAFSEGNDQENTDRVNEKTPNEVNQS